MGGFGKVWKVVHIKNNKTYALKEMLKVKIIHKKCEKSILFEKELLSRLNHDFIVNMHYAFQDYNSLYLVLDFQSGGDLRYHLSQKVIFTEEQIKGLSYIHKSNVIHRDLKPENLVFDSNGYLRITDFGVANLISSNSITNNSSGTPGYMAPEAMCKLPQTFTADFFALGVIGYELMFNKRPFNSKRNNDIKSIMLSKQIAIHNPPPNWSKDCADFINNLLIRKPKNRLGAKDINELFNHPWFNDFNWSKLRSRTLIPPFIPEHKDNFTDKFSHIENEDITTLEQYQKYKENDYYLSMFLGYTFIDITGNDDIILPKIHNPKTTRILRNSKKNFILDPGQISSVYDINNIRQAIEESKRNHKSQEDLLQKYLNCNKTSVTKRKFLKLSNSSYKCMQSSNQVRNQYSNLRCINKERSNISCQVKNCSVNSIPLPDISEI